MNTNRIHPAKFAKIIAESGIRIQPGSYIDRNAPDFCGCGITAAYMAKRKRCGAPDLTIREFYELNASIMISELGLRNDYVAGFTDGFDSGKLLNAIDPTHFTFDYVTGRFDGEAAREVSGV